LADSVPETIERRVSQRKDWQTYAIVFALEGSGTGPTPQNTAINLSLPSGAATAVTLLRERSFRLGQDQMGMRDRNALSHASIRQDTIMKYPRMEKTC
jgi:hypothetical protein